MTKLPCHICNGDGFPSFGDRHIENRKDSCARCGGTGEIEARTGEVPEASAPMAIPPSMRGDLTGKFAHNGPCPDPVVEAVRTDLLQRSLVGLAKYGTPLSRTDLSVRDWAQHAYEEALDFANYLKRMIMELDGTRQAPPAPSSPGVPDSVRALLLERDELWRENLALRGTNPAAAANAVCDSYARENQRLFDRAAEMQIERDALIAARPAAPETPTPVIDVQPTRLSGGKSDYFVRVRCDGREQTLFKLSHRHQAQYTADELCWLLGLRKEKPKLMAYDHLTHPDD